MLRVSILILISLVMIDEGRAQQNLVIKGSDTLGAKMVPLLAEAFKREHSNVSFEIAAEGSTSGIAALIDSTCQIAMSSRSVKPEEESVALGRGVMFHEIIVAYDAMCVIVNESNPLQELKFKDVEGIFTGDVRDWSLIGGKRGRISVYTRNTSSGTYQDWKELAMRKRDYARSSQKLSGNEQIAAEVAKNIGAIGYVGMAYVKLPGIRVMPIIKADGTLVKPSVKAIQSNAWPYARPTYFYTNGVPTGVAKNFIDFVLSSKGQRIVEQAGFVPAVKF
jgi:phosphate transport system substrate-binding protein